MKYPISIEALEVLNAIDRKGSFAAAAEALYRVPSAVTYTVQKLEADLDVVVFRKQGRRAVLTPAGRVLLDQGRELLAGAEKLAYNVKQVASGWEPVINLAVESVLGVESIYPALADFYEIYPDIEVNIYEEVLGGAWEAISIGRADLAVGAISQARASKGMSSQFLTHIDWVLAVSPHHPLLAQTSPYRLEELQDYRLIVVRDSSVNSAPLNKRLFTRAPVLSVPSVRDKINAQVRGLGVGFLPRHLITHYLQSGELVVLKLDESEHLEEDGALSIVWKTGDTGNALRWFVERISGLFLKNSGFRSE